MSSSFRKSVRVRRAVACAIAAAIAAPAGPALGAQVYAQPQVELRTEANDNFDLDPNGTPEGDIYGVIVKNWDETHPKTGGDPTAWDWEIGTGLGHGTLPLRDMRDPTRTGDPDHMNQYVDIVNDNGGVHTNSNIHNKAAYNVLTAVDAQGKTVFTPREVAVLYYLCLTRLTRLATFTQTLNTLLNVAGTYYAGDPNAQGKLDAIKTAYSKVGVS